MSQELHLPPDALRQQYIASLPERARHLDNIWSYLRHLNWSAQGFTALQQFVQKHASASATFNLSELHHAASQLNNFVKDLQALGRSLGGQEYAQMEGQVKHLCQIMHSINHTLSPSAGLNPPAKKTLEAEGKTLFLIDPDRTFASLCNAHLRRVGFTVECFDSPSSCIQRLQQSVPDIIVMDPDFERAGLQALGALQLLKALVPEQTPIVLMSGRTDVNARLRALRAGSRDYLVKPLAMTLLVERLLQIISQQSRHFRVMVVDDDPDMTLLQVEILRSAGMEVISVEQPLQALQQAAQFKPDLVILDMHMPDINGMELAILLRQAPEFLFLPIIFVTADLDTTLHGNLRALGVNSILAKPFVAPDLINCCQQALNRATSLQTRVARITRHPQVSQKINRSYFFAMLEEEIYSSSDLQHSSALYYISIDKLDELSQQLGLVEFIKLHDQVCRRMDECIGSDEQWIDLSNMVICVLAGGRSAEFHQQRCAQLVRHLNAEPFPTHEHHIRLELKTGITLLQSSLGNASQALANAEQQFEANLITIAPTTLASITPAATATTAKPAATTPLSITTRSNKLPPTFSQIVFSRDLSLVFQPIISMEDTRVEHFSVLLRLRGEDGEMIVAKQFLNRINQPAQRIELDRWVLQQAVSAIANNSAAREQATLFIHLAEDTLQQSTFFSFAANVLRSSRLRGAERLVFMLEESWALEHLHQTREIARALHDIQCGICLTRAGDNPAILEVIDQLALDYLRLSPAISNSGSNPALLKQLIYGASRRGTKIIATQIEHSHSLSSLWQQGVRLFEGFFIQPPDEGFHLQNNIELSQKITKNHRFSE